MTRHGSTRLPTVTTQADSWSSPDFLAHPWWLTLSVDARGATREHLVEALRLVVDRHDALRVVPDPVAPASSQLLLALADVSVELEDIGGGGRWDAVDRDAWPIDRPRWIAGVLEVPSRRLVMKVCHSISDQLGLLVLAADLTRAIRARQEGSAPAWRPPASFAAICRAEGSVEGRAELERNSRYVAAQFAPGWVQKPMTDHRRAGESTTRTPVEIGLVISEPTRRLLVAAATSSGVPWQSLLRAALVHADEVVSASGRVRLQSLEHNRRDDERRRCVGNFASYLPVLIDGALSLTLPRREWAELVHSRVREAAEHWPPADPRLAERGLGIGTDLRDEDGEALLMPHLDVDTSATALRAAPLVPGRGDRVGTVRAAASLWRPTEITLLRSAGETVVSLADDTRRRSPRALRLLASCLLGAVQEYAGAAGPARDALELARELRISLGRGPDLEWGDGGPAVAPLSRAGAEGS